MSEEENPVVEEVDEDKEKEELRGFLKSAISEGFDEWVAKQSALIDEEEEAKKKEDAESKESADDGTDGGDGAESRRLSAAERQRESGRVGRKSYYDRIKKILY